MRNNTACAALRTTVLGGWILAACWAAPAAEPAAARSPGIEVWTASVLQRVAPNDRPPQPGKPPAAMDIRGTRNGAFSGQVVLASGGPLRGVRAVVSDLAGHNGARIPASAVLVRYSFDASRADFDVLSEEAPVEVPVDKAAGGAVLPIWITVRVPRDAAPGEYAGRVTVGSVEVPLRLSVAAWTLPNPQGFATHVDLIQSPDSVAMAYDVPLWSEEHWKLLDRTFELLGRIGNKTIYLPLLRRTHFGNEHSMVRWIKQPDGSPSAGSGPAGWKHDFSIVEKYLDVATKHLGKVPVVCAYCWEPFTGGAYLDKPGKAGTGMPFTVLDPATGKLEEAVGPMWGSPEIRAFWKPVFDGLNQRLAERGLAGSLMVGVAQDHRPNRECVEDLMAVAPQAGWVLHTHSFTPSFKLFNQKIGYIAHVWGIRSTPDPADNKRFHGGQNPNLVAVFPREGCGCTPSVRTGSPLILYRLLGEAALVSPGHPHGGSKGLRGFARLGADFWPVLKSRDGRRAGVLAARYPESDWQQLGLKNTTLAVLAPGPKGPVATTRFEMLREGVQECEARILIDRALVEGKIGGELAARCQELLDGRTRALLAAHRKPNEVAPSEWLDRTGKIFAAAAEVSAKLGLK